MRQTAATLTILALAGSAMAGPVSVHNLVGTNAASDANIALTSSAANTAATAISPNGSLGAAFNSANTFCFRDWSTGAIDTSKYYGWSVSADSGYAIDYDTMTFSVASGGGGTANFQVRSSTNGFVSSTTLATHAFSENAIFQTKNLDISALGTVSGTVEFRFYIYSNTASGFAGFGNSATFGGGGPVTVGGSVVDNPVIPLPTGAAMAMVGMGAIGIRRRRA